MKVFILILSTFIFTSYTFSQKMSTWNDSLLTINNHHKIVEFILKNGDLLGISNMEGDTPGYDFHQFLAYLRPKHGVFKGRNVFDRFDIYGKQINLNTDDITINLMRLKQFIYLDHRYKPFSKRDWDNNDYACDCISINVDIQNKKLIFKLSANKKNIEQDNIQNNIYIKPIGKYFEIILNEIKHKKVKL